MHTLRFFTNADVAAHLDYPGLIAALRLGLAQALDRLQSAPPGKPLVLADVADNAGGGASADAPRHSK